MGLRLRFRARRRLPIFLIGALVAAGGGCATAPLTGSLNPGGRRLVLLLDSSTSMRRTDPSRVGPQGAQLVLGLVGSDDNVGVITYAKYATVQRPLRAAGTNRGGLQAQLSGLSRNGITDFASGLALSRDMLEAGRAPPGSAVILLTDGVPYRGRRRARGPALKPILDEFASKGWRIFALALGEEAATPFLSRIVAATGGAVFPVADADRLAPAFAEVATEALGYLRAEKAGREVEVVPHTGRLAFLVQGAELGTITGPGEGAAVEPIQTTAGPFQVGLVEDPAAGKWSLDAPAGAEVVALIEPSFGIEFVEGRPPERLGSREEGQIAVRLVGSADGLAKVRGRVHLRARLVLGADRSLGPPLTLKREGDVFQASFRAPTVPKETALSLVVEAVLAEGGRTFVLKRTLALTVLPGEGKRAPVPLALSVNPKGLSGVAWAGDPAPTVDLTVTGDPERGVQLETPLGTRALAPGAKTTLRVPLRGTSLALSAKTEDGATWSARVPVSLTRYRLSGPATKGLIFGDVAAGAPGGVSIPLGLTLSPGELALEFSPLAGPAGAKLTVVLEGNTLRCEPGRELPAGDYLGQATVRVVGLSLTAKRIPIRIKLLPAVHAPSAVRLRGRWGWVSTAVEIAWPRGGDVAVSFEPSALRGPAVIQPAFDLRVRPLDGWDGVRLGARTRRVALSVYLSSDLPAGSYTGTLVVLDAKAPKQRLEIPVTLTLER
ncbi:MAG: VWA domain-containing protein [Planctomycetes bacterium]|nr:VWA domain-containing protein [Planctomycetota bacterium]